MTCKDLILLYDFFYLRIQANYSIMKTNSCALVKRRIGDKFMRQMGVRMLKAVLCLWLIGIVICIFFVKNPFLVHRINAGREDVKSPEEIYSETAPYVYLEHARLEYTGYYSVTDETIVSYCFITTVGDHSYLVEMSAERVYQLTDDVSEGLRDVSLMGKMRRNDEMVSAIAAYEGMEIQKYQETYDISNISIYQYQNDYESVMIYYGLALLAGAMIFTGTCAGHKKTKESKVSI